MELANASLWSAFFTIIGANIILSGDNAVVIAHGRALAAARAAEEGRSSGAGAAAIVMRIVLTVVAVQLLQLPYLQIIGGVLLLWIGVQLLGDSDDEGEIKAARHDGRGDPHHPDRRPGDEPRQRDRRRRRRRPAPSIPYAAGPRPGASAFRWSSSAAR